MLSSEESQADADRSNHNNEVKNIKDRLLECMGPYESVIFYFQQLVVWERPFHSLIFVLVLHASFWYLKVWSSHAIGFLASILLLLIWLDMWKHKIWPEIRAVTPDPEADEWGELHPRLPSLPELCLIVAEFIVNVLSYVNAILQFRKEYPGKFAFATISACVITIILGKTVPGVLIAYIVMLCCLIWPLLWYRRWIERAYAQVEPFLMQLQYSLKPRMRKRNGKKSLHITREIDGTSVEVHTDSSSDEDLSEFTRPLDAVTAEVLARALTDDDELSESDESLLAHELPSFSHSSSLDGDRGTHTMAEIPLPSAKDFEKVIFDDSASDDEDLKRLDNQVSDEPIPSLSQKIMAEATARAMKTAVNNAFAGAVEKMQDMLPGQHADEDNADSQSSTPSDEGFVVLRENDIE